MGFGTEFKGNSFLFPILAPQFSSLNVAKIKSGTYQRNYVITKGGELYGCGRNDVWI
jgi:alpha-tubulin suppressor-like RCC1 family protein